MNYKNIVFLFLALHVLGGAAQNPEASLTPEELPEIFFGSWLNNKKESVLITTSEYLIFNNKLWYYNAIYSSSSSVEGLKNVFQIECFQAEKHQIITVYLVNDTSLYFEENIANPSIYLNKSEINNRFYLIKYNLNGMLQKMKLA